MERITVLTYCNRIPVFYTLAPLLSVHELRRALDFTDSLDHCLGKDRNRVLLIVRYFAQGRHVRHDRVDTDPLRRLRVKYERIVWFDDSDGAGTMRAEVLPYVDWYVKKQLFRNKRLYLRELYGRQLFSDHYHHRYGVRDQERYVRSPIRHEKDLAKLRLGWNLGIGSYPLRPHRLKVGVTVARVLGVRAAARLGSDPLRYRPGWPAIRKVNARFSPGRRPSIGFQRQLLLAAVAGDDRFLVGRVPQRQYNRESRCVKATLSPFGWGEVCYRDFEAVLNGSLLLKPSMEHLDTWPDIYRPDVTYAPLDWDFGNLMQQVDRYLEDEPLRNEVANNARDAYYDGLRALPSKVDELVRLLDRSSS